MWLAQCRVLLTTLSRSLQSWDRQPHEVVTHLTALLKLPSLALAKPARAGRGRISAQLMSKRRLENSLLPSQLQTIAESMWCSTKEPEPCATQTVNCDEPDEPPPTRQNISDSRAALKCQQLLAAGHNSRASRALTSLHDLADSSDPAVREKLAAMHPARLLPLPPQPNDTPQIQIDHATLANIMARSDNGSAPGPSGWGANMLASLANDPTCVEAFAQLVTHIVNNQLPPEATSMLTASSLVALSKKGNGVRPIAVGELFYRVSAQYAMQLVDSHISTILGPNQYGVQTPNGAAQVIHSIQHLLSTDNSACLSIDIANAFNSLERAAIFESLYSEPALMPLWKITQFAYSNQSTLVLRERSRNTKDTTNKFHTIASANGVRQGDPLSSLLFALAVRNVFDAAADECDHKAFCFIDDANFVGKADQLLRIIDSIKPKLAQIGLRVNDSKCMLTCFTPLQEQQLQPWLQLQIPVNNDHNKMLGAVVAQNVESIVKCLNDNSSEWSNRRDALYRRLPMLSVQNQMYVLRHMNASTINHQLACLPPAASIAHARHHDQLMLAAATNALGLDTPVSAASTTQLMLPLSKGGFGLLSAAQNAAPAYLSAVFNTLTNAPPFVRWSDGTQPLPAHLQVHAFIQAAIDQARTNHQTIANSILPSSATVDMNIDSDILPTSASTMISFYRSKQLSSIQSSLTLRTSKHLYTALVNEVENGLAVSSKNFHLARLQSVLADESHRWLTVTPHHFMLRLADEEYRWMAKYRLGLDITGIQDLDYCPCCKKHQAFTNDPWHYLSCSTLISVWGTARHNDLTLKLKNKALMGGCHARHEPSQLSTIDQKRPDVELFTFPQSTLIDAVVSNPIAPSHIQSAKRRPLAVAEEAVARKQKKYKDMTEYQEADFKAFACETFGGMSRSAKLVVALIGNITASNCPWVSRREVVQDMLDEIAISIQRGNAAMVRAGELKRRIAARITV